MPAPAASKNELRIHELEQLAYARIGWETAEEFLTEAEKEEYNELVNA